MQTRFLLLYGLADVYPILCLTIDSLKEKTLQNTTRSSPLKRLILFPIMCYVTLVCICQIDLPTTLI